MASIARSAPKFAGQFQPALIDVRDRDPAILRLGKLHVQQAGHPAAQDQHGLPAGQSADVLGADDAGQRFDEGALLVIDAVGQGIRPFLHQRLGHENILGIAAGQPDLDFRQTG